MARQMDESFGDPPRRKNGRTMALKAGLIALVGALMVSGGAIALQGFVKAGYFHDAVYPNGWIGYDKATFTGLAFFTFLTTPGFALLYTGVTLLSRIEDLPQAIRLGSLFALATVCMIVGWVAFGTWAWEIMQCGGFACTNYPSPPTPGAEAGDGWKSTVGNMAFWSLVPTSFTLLAVIVYRLAHNSLPRIPAHIWPTYEIFEHNSTHIVRTAFIMLAMLFVLFWYTVITLYMPNSWEYFTPHRIGSYGSWLIASDNYHLCNEFYNIFTCPEVPWAYFRTGNWYFRDKIIVKLYPSNLFFFSYLAIMLFGTVTIRASMRGRNFLDKTFPIYGPSVKSTFTERKVVVKALVRVSVGKCLGYMLTTLLIILFSIYWLHDHNFDGMWARHPRPILSETVTQTLVGEGDDDLLGNTTTAPTPTNAPANNTPVPDRGPRHHKGHKQPYFYDMTMAERVARTFGQVAVVFMSLLMFPTSRSSVLHTLLGTTWESLISMHRVLGYGMLVCMLGHMFAWWRTYYITAKETGLNLWPTDIFDVPMALPESIDNFTVPLSNLATFLTFICMGILAIPQIRRWRFEIFYYSHLAAAYILIPTVLWHAAGGWEYLLPGLTVWFIDRLVRFYRSAKEVHVVNAQAFSSKVTELEFTQPGLVVPAGQYVFVNIPELAIFEWHPFTISGCTGPNTYTLHIKEMGEGTWTARLHDLVTAGECPTLAVDGPHGAQIALLEYTDVILVCGGIGITPCLHILTTLARHARNNDTSSTYGSSTVNDNESTALMNRNSPDVTFLWAARSTTLADSFADRISEASATLHANAKIFVTKGNVMDTASPSLKMVSGRPNMALEMEEAVGRGDRRVLVFACGPEALVDDTEALAAQNGYHFHRETFLL